MSKPHIKYEIAHEQILWFGKNALEEIKIIFWSFSNQVRFLCLIKAVVIKEGGQSTG